MLTPSQAMAFRRTRRPAAQRRARFVQAMALLTPTLSVAFSSSSARCARGARLAEAEASAKPRRASLNVLLVPAAAIALALAVWASTPRLGGLAPYELEVVSPTPLGPVIERPGEREQVPRVELGPGRELSVLLRPRATSTEAVEASVFVRSFAASGGGALSPVPAVAKEVGPGVLRVMVSGTALPDAGRLVVLVGRSGLLPGSPVGTASHGRDWQRFEVDFISAAPAAP
jgi:hypothetical protein